MRGSGPPPDFVILVLFESPMSQFPDPFPTSHLKPQFCFHLLSTTFALSFAGHPLIIGPRISAIYLGID